MKYSEKKERALIERIIGCYNEGDYRVVCILGLKLKFRSKILILQRMLEEQRTENNNIRRECNEQKKQIKQINGLVSRQNQEIVSAGKTLNELTQIVKELKDSMNSSFDEINASLEKQKGIYQALDKREGADFADMKRELQKIRDTLRAQEHARQALDKRERDDVASLRRQLEKAEMAQLKLDKALVDRAATLRTDYLARVSNVERKLMIKMHKYCPEDKLELALCDWYRERMQGRVLNLQNPTTYNEKVQWLKLHDATPVKTLLADKYLVRDWVAERVGQEYLIPLLGAWDSFDAIDFDSLPDRFVIKCNHGCGYNVIVKDKSQFDRAAARKKIDWWMGEDFSYKAGLEMHYSAIPHKVIVEEFIENVGSEGGDLYDYKFWCFDGRVQYIQFLSERNTNGLKMAFYDREWNKQNFVYSYPLDTKDMPRPDNLDEMIAVAEKLAEGFCHVRVDLYRMDDGRLYFGEMTFTSASGACMWQPEEMDLKMGNLLKLPL